MAVACPRCQRPNAAHRSTCLYCGVAMPEPAVPPLPVERALPPDFDRLVAEAMAGRGVGKLRAALQATGPVAETAAPVRVGEEPSPSRIEPMPVRSASLPIEGDAHSILARMAAGVERARGAWARGDAASARQEVAALRRQADQVAELLPATAAPPVEPVLPSVHRAFLLVIDGAGDPEVGPVLARALGLDHVTGRLLAVPRHPTVARRAEDRADLDPAAAAVRRESGMAAMVVSRDDLLAVTAPRLVLRAQGLDDLVVTDLPLWSAADVRPDALPAGETADGRGVMLAVPGEVVVRRFRTQAARRGRDATVRDSGERRVGVLDLHAEGAFFRLVEGVTDFAGLPGHHATSSRLSLRGLVEGLGQRWPTARVLGRRVCQPGDRPARGEDVPDGLALQSSGWPVWEEHSRLCRLLLVG